MIRVMYKAHKCELSRYLYKARCSFYRQCLCYSKRLVNNNMVYRCEVGKAILDSLQQKIIDFHWIIEMEDANSYYCIFWFRQNSLGSWR